LVCVSQAGLEQAFGGLGALLFSQCNVVWGSFMQAGVSLCQSIASSWWFFPALLSQQDFLFTELTLSASSLYFSSWIFQLVII
jgi:hypothetical protein